MIIANQCLGSGLMALKGASKVIAQGANEAECVRLTDRHISPGADHLRLGSGSKRFRNFGAVADQAKVVVRFPILSGPKALKP